MAGRLADDGTPLRRKDWPRCGARTRKGAPCLVKVEAGKALSAVAGLSGEPALVPELVEATALEPVGRDDATGWVKWWETSACAPKARRLYIQVATGVNGSMAEQL